MKHQNNNFLNILTYTTIFSKVIWVIFGLIILYMRGGNYNHKKKTLTKTENIIMEIDHIAHTVFHLGIGMLLIYFFNHLNTKKICLEGEHKTNFYLFGIFMIVINLYKFFMKMYHKKNTGIDSFV